MWLKTVIWEKEYTPPNYKEPTALTLTLKLAHEEVNFGYLFLKCHEVNGMVISGRNV